ncbi:MAG: PhoX family phosphatase [Pseudomonadota bacterium]
MSTHFKEISRRFLSRRQLLVAAAGTALFAHPLARAAIEARQTAPAVPTFAAIDHDMGDDHFIAQGYQAKLLIGWGDSLLGEQSSRFPLSDTEQASRFGYNNDYIAYMPLDGSKRGLLCVNHEYTLGHMMFPGFNNFIEVMQKSSPAQTRAEMMAVGHSIIEVAQQASGWRVVNDSRYARRITATTPMRVDGPAAGQRRLATSKDPSATKVLGTLACCAGGKTPWGTVLIAEENFGDFFTGDPSELPAAQAEPIIESYEWTQYFPQWARTDPRFNINQEPNEYNRFGWIVEFDPYDPQATPVKRTALGRFEHEGATPVCKPGKPVVVYTGDDHVNEFVYRFISSANYQPDQRDHNLSLLSSGTLYVARFDDDGSGQWIPLIYGNAPLNKANGFNSHADVMIDCRRAAALMGATPMDRPEDIEVSPATDRVYVALTKNTKKEGPQPANPGAANPAGHIVEIIPPGTEGDRDHTSSSFHWDILLQAGNPAETGVYGGDIKPSDWFANPDNFAFDAKNRLWIATDGCENFGFADGLWCTATTGARRAMPRHFYRGPRGSEICGPEFTPDGRSLFIAVQHPADERGSTYSNPTTRWPDFKPDVPPRPSIVAITRDDGGLIGD